LKKGNILDIAAKAVRNSNKTNMFDRKSVQYWAYHFGFYEYVTWIQEAQVNDYFEHLAIINFKLTPDADCECREDVVDFFSNEIEEFHQFGSGFFNIKPFPFSSSDLNAFKSIAYDFMDDRVPDHLMNYCLNTAADTIYWFSDGFFTLNKKLVPINLDGYKRYVSQKPYLSKENQSKFKKLEHHFRLDAIFE
jgi:hypothetical protein